MEKIETIDCPDCLGVGTIFDGHTENTCSTCKGEGKIEVWYDDEDPISDDAQNIDLLLNKTEFVEFDEEKHSEQ